MENAEKALGLIEKEKKLEEIRRMLDEARDRLPEDFYKNMKKLLEA